MAGYMRRSGYELENGQDHEAALSVKGGQTTVACHLEPFPDPRGAAS
jgi:hypothetical protein